jgi:hypothetical protein
MHFWIFTKKEKFNSSQKLFVFAKNIREEPKLSQKYRYSKHFRENFCFRIRFRKNLCESVRISKRENANKNLFSKHFCETYIFQTFLRSGSPIQAASWADLLRLSCPDCPSPTVLSRMSWPSCLVRVVLSQMSSLNWHRCSILVALS